MLGFNDYLKEDFDYALMEEYGELIEKLITFGGQAYPKFGNVIIMAGGAGSGKGFIKNNLVGAEGFNFDVDDIKKLAAAAPGIVKKIKDELGDDLAALGKNMGVGNEKNVARVHEIIGDYLRLDSKKKQAMFASVMTAAPDRKPNMIFDVTLKSMSQLQKNTFPVQNLGYDKKNIHIVWVVNDIEIAKKQNISRGMKPGGRTVPVEILVDTHQGASQTMLNIINMGKDLEKYMDGDIVFAFNQVGVDSALEKSDKGGSYVKDANYIYIKRQGKPVMSLDDISDDIRRKIASYVPKNASWE